MAHVNGWRAAGYLTREYTRQGIGVMPECRILTEAECFEKLENSLRKYIKRASNRGYMYTPIKRWHNWPICYPCYTTNRVRLMCIKTGVIRNLFYNGQHWRAA